MHALNVVNRVIFLINALRLRIIEIFHIISTNEDLSNRTEADMVIKIKVMALTITITITIQEEVIIRMDSKEINFTIIMVGDKATKINGEAEVKCLGEVEAFKNQNIESFPTKTQIGSRNLGMMNYLFKKNHNFLILKDTEVSCTQRIHQNLHLTTVKDTDNIRKSC